MADDEVGRQHAEAVEVLRCGEPRAPQKLLVLRHGLGGVDRERQAAHPRRIRGVPEEVLPAGFHLGRSDNAGQAAARMRPGRVDRFQGLGEALSARALVPDVIEAVAVRHAPSRLPETRGEVAPRTAPGEDRQPIRVRASQVNDRGAARQHEFGQHDREQGRPDVGVGVEQGRILIEGVAPQRRGADVVEHALGDRLVARMAMHVDESRHHQAAAPRQLAIRRTSIA